MSVRTPTLTTSSETCANAAPMVASASAAAEKTTLLSIVSSLICLPPALDGHSMSQSDAPPRTRLPVLRLQGVLPQESEQQFADSCRLLLLHPMTGAVEQMTA